MDGNAILPSGPRKVGAKNQVAVPAEMLEAIGVQVGEEVVFVVNPDRPGTILILEPSWPRFFVRDG